MGSGGHRVMLLMFGLLVLLGSGAALVVVAPLQRTMQQPQPISEPRSSMISAQGQQNAPIASALDRSTTAVQVVRTYVAHRLDALRGVSSRERTVLGVAVLFTMITPVLATTRLLARNRGGRMPHPDVARSPHVANESAAPAWIQSDENDRRGAVVMQVVMSALRDGNYRSTIGTISWQTMAADPTIELTFVLHPQDRSRLGELVGAVKYARPAWKVEYADERLHLIVDAPATSVSNLPLMVPVLECEHERGKWVTSAVLDSVGHLGVFGADAEWVLHAVLTELLCTFGPRRLNVTVLGAPAIARVYATAPHAVLPPDDAAESIEALCQHGREAAWLRPGPPMLAVLIEPDPSLLEAIARLLCAKDEPSYHGLHIVIVMNECPRQLRANQALAGLHSARTSAEPRDGFAAKMSRDELRISGLRLRGYAPRQSRNEAEQLMRLLPCSIGASTHGD